MPLALSRPLQASPRIVYFYRPMQRAIGTAMRASTALLSLLSALLISPRVAVAFCFDAAGEAYRIDPLLLQAIATVESSLRSDALHHNANGTRDIGLMQINSVHLPRLIPRGISQQRLLHDPCLSVMIGADDLPRETKTKLI